MRGEKRKIHFLPEFCKVISEPQWIYTAAHSHSSTFTASFEPHPFPSHNYLHCPKDCVPALITLSYECSNQGSSFLTPRTRQVGTSQPPAQSGTRQLLNHTRYLTLSPHFLFLELNLPSCYKLTWDLKLWHIPSKSHKQDFLPSIPFSCLHSVLPSLYSPVSSLAAHLLSTSSLILKSFLSFDLNSLPY